MARRLRQVYKGRRKCTGQITAMKFIMKHGKSEKDIKNLRQEIEILRQLRHEHIIQMLDAFETKTDFCVVTGAAGSKRDVHGLGRGGRRARRAGVCSGTTRARLGCLLAWGRCTTPPRAEFAQGELFEILEDDQSLPEDVVQVRPTHPPQRTRAPAHSGRPQRHTCTGALQGQRR